MCAAIIKRTLAAKQGLSIVTHEKDECVVFDTTLNKKLYDIWTSFYKSVGGDLEKILLLTFHASLSKRTFLCKLTGAIEQISKSSGAIAPLAHP